VIFSRPATIRSVVDFPHPERPTSTMNSPFSMCRLIFLTAVNVGRPGVIHIGLHQILDFYGTFTTHGISFLGYRYLRFTHSVPIQKQRQPPRIPFAELRAISESFGVLDGRYLRRTASHPQAHIPLFPLYCGLTAFMSLLCVSGPGQ